MTAVDAATAAAVDSAGRSPLERDHEGMLQFLKSKYISVSW